MSNKREINVKNGKLVFEITPTQNQLYDPNLFFEMLESAIDVLEDIEYSDNPKIMSSILFNKITSAKKSQYLAKYSAAFENILRFETDIVTMEIIKQLYGINGDAENVIAYMANLIYNNAQPTSKNDINNVRLRFAELLAQILYKELSASLDKYMKDKESKTEKATSLSRYFNKDTIMNKMFETTAFGYRLPELLQLLETSSPIEEQSTYYTFKFGGPDGIKPEQQMMDIAVLHPSSYGVIAAYDTPENQNTSRTNRLTLGAYIKTRYGKLDKSITNNFAILSPVEALIPFIEHNDGNRILLATNQLRSVVPVHKPEIPIIMTGGEEIFSHLTSGIFIKRAKKPGKVIHRSDEFIIVEYDDGEREFIDTTYSILRTGKGTYLIHYNAIKKDTFNENDVLVYSDYFDYNILQTGINTLVAFLHYPGLTYEDGIVVSETFAKKLGITRKVHVITIPIYDNEVIKFVYTKKDFIKNGTILVQLEKQILVTVNKDKNAVDNNNIEESATENNIAVDEEGEFDISSDADIIAESEIIGKIKNIRGKRGRIIDIEVYANTKNIDEKLKPIYEEFKKKHQEYIEYYSKHQPLTEPKYLFPDGRGKYKYRDKTPKYIIRYIIETYNEAKLGDKLCNRHGNKGVITKILPDELMPKTKYGETIHVILDPMGIVNRMNVGQVLEAAIAYLSKHVYLKKVKDLNSFITTYKKFCNILYSENPDFLHKINNVLTNQDFRKLYEMAQKIQALPLYIPPFESPLRGKRLDIIKKLETIFGIETTQELYLPEFNTKTIDKVQIGYMYMFRLEHVTEEVLHTRYIGKKRGLSQQAVKGKKQEGGYRLGEFDSWQLINNDVPNVIRELFYVNSETSEFEDHMIKNIISDGKTDLPKEYKLRSQDLTNIIKHVLFIK